MKSKKKNISDAEFDIVGLTHTVRVCEKHGEIGMSISLEYGEEGDYCPKCLAELVKDAGLPYVSKSHGRRTGVILSSGMIVKEKKTGHLIALLEKADESEYPAIIQREIELGNLGC